MRTDIEIDDALMAEALTVSGLTTRRAVVEEGLRLLISLHRQAEIKDLVGTVRWQGDLNESRRGRGLP